MKISPREDDNGFKAGMSRPKAKGGQYDRVPRPERAGQTTGKLPAGPLYPEPARVTEAPGALRAADQEDPPV
jgi:hypothetical protein